MLFAGQIGELGELAFELLVNGACGAMALPANNNFGLAMGTVHFVVETVAHFLICQNETSSRVTFSISMSCTDFSFGNDERFGKISMWEGNAMKKSVRASEKIEPNTSFKLVELLKTKVSRVEFSLAPFEIKTTNVSESAEFLGNVILCLSLFT